MVKPGTFLNLDPEKKDLAQRLGLQLGPLFNDYLTVLLSQHLEGDNITLMQIQDELDILMHEVRDLQARITILQAKKTQILTVQKQAQQVKDEKLDQYIRGVKASGIMEEMV